MKTVALGSQGLSVTQMGYGCMGLTTAYGAKLPDDQIIALLQKVHAAGVNFWDTANLYAFPDYWRLLRFASPVVVQEEIIRYGLEKVGRENIVMASKTGIELHVFPTLKIIPNGSPQFIRKQCEASLRRLNIDCLDLFYLHRIDPNIPIEISMTEMKKLVEEGKIKYVGLSECSASTIRRAHKIHPLTCVQMEYSLWCRDIEDEVIPTCAELGIGLVAYSPLGRGFFGGKASSGQFEKGDFRATQERMTGEAGERNKQLLDKVQEIADAKGVTTAQLALAWVMAQEWRLNGAGVVPIPGTTKEKNLMSNVAATEFELTTEDVAALEAAVPKEEVAGGRYEAGHGTWDVEKNRELTEEEKAQMGL